MAEQAKKAIVKGNIIAKDFFIYEADASALAAGSSTALNVAIQADSDFILQKIGYAADIAGAAQTDSTRVVPLVTMLITDTGSGRQLMNAAAPITTFIGDGRLPFILPQPKMFVARTTVTLAIANYSAATTYNLRFSLIGTKVFRV